MYVQFKDKGIDFAKQAVEEDEQGNYEKAVQLYLASLEYFKTYLKYEKNQKAKEAIMGKVSRVWPTQVGSAHEACLHCSITDPLSMCVMAMGCSSKNT
jgi:hypothetical protein